MKKILLINFWLVFLCVFALGLSVPTNRDEMANIIDVTNHSNYRMTTNASSGVARYWAPGRITNDATTSHLPEGTNQYFTTNRVHAASTNVYEPVFAKGSLIQGANAFLTGILTNRLIGTGDVTIAMVPTNAVDMTVYWSNILDAPTVFPVTNHYHPGSDITNIVTNAVYAGTATNALSGWPTEWPWESITNKPTQFTPTNHYHAGTDVTNVVTNAIYAETATNALSGWPTNWPWISITNPPTTDLITEGSTNLYHTTNRVLLATTNVYEPVFSKGNIVQGTNIVLTGTLTNRLYGTGDVSVNIGSHTHPGTDITSTVTNATYADTATNIFMICTNHSHALQLKLMYIAGAHRVVIVK